MCICYTGDKVSCVGVIKNAHSVIQQTAGKRKKNRLGSVSSQVGYTSFLYSPGNKTVSSTCQ